MKWQIGSRRRSGRRRTGYVERGDEARTYPGTLHRGPSSCVKCSTVEKTTWSRREEERKHRTRKEKKKKKKKRRGRTGGEEEPREKSTRRGFCYEAATFRRRHIHSDTLLVTLLSAFFPSLSSFLSFSLSFFLLPSPIRKNHSLDTRNATKERIIIIKNCKYLSANFTPSRGEF